MKLLVLLSALLIERVWPLRAGNPVEAAYTRFAHYLQLKFDAGNYRQGVMAWLLAVVPLTLLVFWFENLLASSSATLAWLFGAALLYATVGFRQSINFINKSHAALKNGDVAAVRDQLRLWRNENTNELDADAATRLAIESGLLHAHRNVFAPVAWFLVFGPAGALLYRMAAMVQTLWHARTVPEAAEPETEVTESPMSESVVAESMVPEPVEPESAVAVDFSRFATRAFAVIDWLPARLTAASFAAAGNFQDAVECWRTQASSWVDQATGIILASGGGALGVKLGGDLQEHGRVRDRPELGTGDPADLDHLSSAVGLIWRAMATWILLLVLVTVARLSG